MISRPLWSDTLFLKSGAAPPHSKTQARKGSSNDGHVLECGLDPSGRFKCARPHIQKSKQQDKDAGDHQREHPDEIDVEPRAAQYRDPKFFVNHNRDQRGG